MKLHHGKEQFIETWGQMAGNWGISKSVAQIHAILLISKDPMCSDMIMQRLDYSRGSTNQSLHTLLEWKLIFKTQIEGDRKEYFYAEKDMWTMFRQIAYMRKEKELDPMIALLTELSDVNASCPDSDEFCRVVRDMKTFAERSESAISHMINSRNNPFINTFFNLIK